MPNTKTERVVLIAILVGFALLSTVYSITIPIFEASDELWHYPMVQHIAENWTLPVQPLTPGAPSGPWRQEASQPPLYYQIGALLTFWINTSDMPDVRHLNPHVAAGEVTPDGSNVNLVVHNPAREAFPWQGTVLAVHIVRFFSVLLGTWAVYLTWALVHELYPNKPWLALSAAAVHAFTPMYVFISASVNNDNLIVPLCTLALLMMVRLVKGQATNVKRQTSNVKRQTSSVKAYGILGIVLGLGLLTKASAIGLLPLAVATVAWDVWQRLSERARERVSEKARKRKSEKARKRKSERARKRKSERAKKRKSERAKKRKGERAKKRKGERASKRISEKVKVGGIVYVAVRNLGLIFVPALLIAGWWFYRNFRLYQDWLGLNAFYAVLGTRDVPANFAQLWAERFAFAAGYWGNFGGLNLLMPDWVYTLLNTVAVIAMLGIAVRFGLWVVGYGERNEKQRSKKQEARSEEARSEEARNLSTRFWEIRHRLSLRNLWPFTWDAMTAARALAWVWPVAVFVSWIRWATVTWSSQGRLIFSALPMWSLALIMGLQIPAGYGLRITDYVSRITRYLLPTFLLILCVVALPVWILPAYTPPPPAPLTNVEQPHEVQFDNVLRLHGYTLETQAVTSGTPVKLTLFWEALGPTASDHSIFIHILGSGERIVAQRDTFPGRGLLSTMWLESGRTWQERYHIQIPPMAYAPDDLAFAVGVVDHGSGQRLMILQADKATQDLSTRFGHVNLVPKPGDLPNPVNVQFGRGILLTGYDLDDLTLARGDQVNITLHWRCEAPIEENYTMSVQVIDTEWHKAAQSDAWPRNGAAPTSSWHRGQHIEEQRTLTIAPDAAPGVYEVRLAAYRMDADGQLIHLPIKWATDQMPVKDMMLTRVRVQ